MKLLKSSVSILALLGLAACSNGGGGGGGAPAAPKPNTQPATEIARGFTVVKNAGQNQQGPQPTSLFMAAAPQTSPDSEKVRTQNLKKLISQQMLCRVEFNSAPQNGMQNGGGNPGPMPTTSDMNFNFTLKISGNGCPVTADYGSVFDIDMMTGWFKMNFNYEFVATTQDAQSLIGATQGKMSGEMHVEQAPGSPAAEGKGKFEGAVESLQYGHVALNGTSHAVMQGQDSWTMTDELKFTFEKDASMNLDLIRVMTMTSGKNCVDISYKANGMSITQNEFDEIAGDMIPGEQNSQSYGNAKVDAKMPSACQTQVPSQNQKQSGPTSSTTLGALSSLNGKNLNITVLNPSILSQVAGNTGAGLINGRVYSEADGKPLVTATTAACFVTQNFASGLYSASVSQQNAQENYYLTLVELKNGPTLACVTKDAPMTDAGLIQAAFNGVLSFQVQ